MIGHILSYLDFVTDWTLFDRSQQVNFFFDVDCMISHVVVLCGFRHSWHPNRLIMIVQYCENVYYTCTIGHTVVLYGFHLRLYPIQSIITTQIFIGIDHICTIYHVVILSGFHDIPHLVRYDLTVQF